MNRIGTVEILKLRVYPLDAECHCESGSTVVVQPGRYGLFGDGMSTFWLMRGVLNQQGIWRMGDGMFAIRGIDVPTEIEVVFPSRRFGADEWKKLRRSPELAEGPAQRLRVHLDVADEVAS